LYKKCSVFCSLLKIGPRLKGPARMCQAL